jgi:hypothetical protein
MRRIVGVVILAVAAGAMGGCAGAKAESHTYEQAHGARAGSSCPSACANDTAPNDYSTIRFADTGP